MSKPYRTARISFRTFPEIENKIKKDAEKSKTSLSDFIHEMIVKKYTKTK